MIKEMEKQVLMTGDMFQSKAQTLVNAVNCVGVMGKGIALEFKNRFPEMHQDYVHRCDLKKVKLGEPYIFKGSPLPYIINFPTKDHWKSSSRIQDIERGLEYLLTHYKEWEVTSLAVPALGCGNGGLEWSAIEPLIFKYVKLMNISAHVYAPYEINVAKNS